MSASSTTVQKYASFACDTKNVPDAMDITTSSSGKPSSGTIGWSILEVIKNVTSREPCTLWIATATKKE
jgi:hypothetical protein